MLLVSGCAAAAVMVLAGCGSATGAPKATATQPAPPTVPRPHHRPGVCRSKDVAAAHHGGEGAGSQEYSVISLRNIGAHSCRLDGWPTVRLLNAAHKQIERVAGHRSSTAPKLVVLAPRQLAGVTISVGSVSVPTAAQCGRESTSAIKLTLPGGATLTVPAVIHICTREYDGLTTGPVRRGGSLAMF